MPTIMITGANKGLGLEFVKQYSQNNFQVIACCRDPSKASELTELSQKNNNIDIHQLDILNQDQVSKLANMLAKKPIDILLHNAGIYGQGKQSWDDITLASLQATMLTNAFSPFLLTKAFIKSLHAGERKQVVYISSLMGSISDNNSGGVYAYRASKTAGNMLMKSLAIDLAKDNMRVLILHPGWVLTDMGGPNAPIDTATSIQGMRKVIERDDTTNGGFYNYKGEVLPW
jgi:NAD(P)-dependent dehydrogenase (short-subunit alcohol dehydrogenase family)